MIGAKVRLLKVPQRTRDTLYIMRRYSLAAQTSVLFKRTFQKSNLMLYNLESRPGVFCPGFRQFYRFDIPRAFLSPLAAFAPITSPPFAFVAKIALVFDILNLPWRKYVGSQLCTSGACGTSALKTAHGQTSRISIPNLSFISFFFITYSFVRVGRLFTSSTTGSQLPPPAYSRSFRSL